MLHQLELYAQSIAAPETLWEVVADLSRLPEWTDATAVEELPDLPLEVGDRFVTLHDGDRLEWTLITVAPHLLEARTATASGRLGVGARVAPDPAGARFVLAGLFDPSVGALRARLVTVPRWRRRLDAWARAAVEVADRAAGS